MAKREHRRASARVWAAQYGQYVLLAIVAAITVFLVILALSAPALPPGSRSAPSPNPTKSAVPTSESTPGPSKTSTPTPTPAKVAFLGDSYTAGDGATAVGKRWVTLLSDAHGWTEVNAGRPGSGYATSGTSPQSGPYTERVAEVVAAAPDVVIVSGGRFDFAGSSSVTNVSAAIVETFAALGEGLPNAQIFAIGPIWDNSAPPARLSQISLEVRKAVKAINGTYIDIGQPLEGKPDLVVANGFVPNNAGHAVLFEVIAAALSPLLRTEYQ